MKGSLRRRRSSEEPKEVREQLATVRAERAGRGPGRTALVVLVVGGAAWRLV